METWNINVGGYGAFLFSGSEDEAEEMRRHKARHEAAPAKKRKATKEEIERGKADQDWW